MIGRKTPNVVFRRERLDLPDGDFLDLDWLKAFSRRVVILLHGLEGNSSRKYIKGMARIFFDHGWSVLAMNFRGCSGETNRLLRSYHAGATEDLRAVVEHIESSGQYDEIGLVGFSLGGNLLLKFLGEEGRTISSSIIGAAAFSVPCDLAGSVNAISAGANRIYMKRFLKQLRRKIEAKQKLFPGEIDLSDYEIMTTFYEFDNRYTAPIHGFKDAFEYWKKNSCISFLPRITVPVIIVNAADDPFLSVTCFPRKEAEASHFLFLEIPDYGGHVGFVSLTHEGQYWSEHRALAFLTKHSGPRTEGMGLFT